MLFWWIFIKLLHLHTVPYFCTCSLRCSAVCQQLHFVSAHPHLLTSDWIFPADRRTSCSLFLNHTWSQFCSSFPQSVDARKQNRLESRRLQRGHTTDKHILIMSSDVCVPAEIHSVWLHTIPDCFQPHGKRKHTFLFCFSSCEIICSLTFRLVQIFILFYYH